MVFFSWSTLILSVTVNSGSGEPSGTSRPSLLAQTHSLCYLFLFYKSVNKSILHPCSIHVILDPLDGAMLYVVHLWYVSFFFKSSHLSANLSCQVPWNLSRPLEPNSKVLRHCKWTSVAIANQISRLRRQGNCNGLSLKWTGLDCACAEIGSEHLREPALRTNSQQNLRIQLPTAIAVIFFFFSPRWPKEENRWICLWINSPRHIQDGPLLAKSRQVIRESGFTGRSRTGRVDKKQARREKHAGKTRITQGTICLNSQLVPRSCRCVWLGGVAQVERDHGSFDHVIYAVYVASYQGVSHLWIKERISPSKHLKYSKMCYFTSQICCDTTVLQKPVDLSKRNVLQFVPDEVRLE